MLFAVHLQLQMV